MAPTSSSGALAQAPRGRFSGSSLTWVTMTGPAHGKAEVYVDGTLRGTYNNYSERVRFGVERSLTGLGAGQHTVEVRALGKKGARAGTGTLVAVDGFVTASGSVVTPVVTQSWQRIDNANASNGYYSIADLAGQTATIDFRGPSVTLHTAVGPRFGDVALYVDGELARSVDLYAPIAGLWRAGDGLGPVRRPPHPGGAGSRHQRTCVRRHRSRRGPHQRRLIHRSAASARLLATRYLAKEDFGVHWIDRWARRAAEGTSTAAQDARVT